jgi:hypothetical protein
LAGFAKGKKTNITNVVVHPPIINFTKRDISTPILELVTKSYLKRRETQAKTIIERDTS